MSLTLAVADDRQPLRVAAPIGALGVATQIVVGVLIYAAAILILFRQARRGAWRGFAFAAERGGSKP